MHSLDPNVAAQVGAWLATYLIHGVALFAAAWLGTRAIQNVRVREQLWRAALFGPLVTASLQLGAGIAPLGGQWDIALQPGAAPITAAAPVIGSVHELESLPPGQNSIVVLVKAEGGRHMLGRDVAFAPALYDETALEEAAAGKNVWTLLATLSLAAGIAALMIRALLEALRVQRLGRGVVLTRGPIVRAAETFARRARILRRVRVEVTESGTSPYATGVLFPRIVVPERAMAELDDAAIRAMVAHETGHIARLDPLWTTAIRSVSALFFFQPLNWIIAQRLDECAEFCCDEFAVDATGDEIALARCLASVADWIVGPQKARPACAMAHKRSPLGQRVERILATDGEVQRRHVGARLISPLAICATALAVPGFAITLDPGHELAELALEAEANISSLFGSAGLKFTLEASPPVEFVTPTGNVTRGDQRVQLMGMLESSIDVLDAELAEVLTLAAGHEISTETQQQLQSMLERAARIRKLTRLATQYAAASASPNPPR